jgi:outer membrane protein OmpA-like peptidoglycan-associated protein
MKEALNDGQTIRFQGVLFDHDKANLKRDSMPIVFALAAALLESPEIRVNINGYTDSHGGLDYNIDLSRRRAQAVEEALVKQGVSKERLHVNAYGVASPIADNSTEDGRARNRRVEVVPASD